MPKARVGPEAGTVVHFLDVLMRHLSIFVIHHKIMIPVSLEDWRCVILSSASLEITKNQT